MKSKHLFTPPHKITALFLSGVLVLSCSSCSGAQSSSASEHNSKQKFLIPPLVRKRIYLQQNKI